MLAHQGGWDEMLLVAVPVVLIVLALWRATLRVDRQNAATRESAPSNVGSDSGEATDQIVVSAIDVMNVADLGDAIGDQSGHD